MGQNADTSPLSSPLMAAAIHGDAEACALLAPLSAPNQLAHANWTALMFAVQNNHLACIPVLAQHCDVGQRNKQGHDALAIACFNNHPQAALMLLKLTETPNDDSIILAIAATISHPPGGDNDATRLLRQWAHVRAERLEIEHAASASAGPKAPAPRL